MFRLEVKSDYREVERMLTDVQRKQLPFATARAMTKTAQDVQQATIDEMKRVLDRPKRFTLKSTYVKPAKKHDLEARVGLKDFAPKGTAADKYLSPQIEGGARSPKRFEMALRHARVLPPGMFAVPSKTMRLDRYGNVSKGMQTKILSVLKASPDPMQNSTARTKKVKLVYFVARIKGAHGIWQRMAGRKVKLLFVFVKAPRYRKRFDFHGVASRTANKWFEHRFNDSLAKALKS